CGGGRRDGARCPRERRPGVRGAAPDALEDTPAVPMDGGGWRRTSSRVGGRYRGGATGCEHDPARRERAVRAAARRARSRDRSHPDAPGRGGDPEGLPRPHRGDARRAGRRSTMTAVSPEMPIRVMLVDDHEVVRDGIKSLLKAQDGITVSAEA